MVRTLASCLVLVMIAGCLGPNAHVVPGTGGVECGLAPVVQWREPGLYDEASLLAHDEVAPEASLASGLDRLVPAVPGLALEEIYLDPGNGVEGLRTRATIQGVFVTLVVREALSEPERANQLLGYLEHFGESYAASGTQMLAALEPSGILGDETGRLVVLEGYWQKPLHADHLIERLVLQPPGFETTARGSGEFTLIWDAGNDSSPLRAWILLKAPVRTLDLEVGTARARLSVDAGDGAALTLNPMEYPDDSTHLQNDLRDAFEAAGLPPPAYHDWVLVSSSWTCNQQS